MMVGLMVAEKVGMKVESTAELKVGLTVVYLVEPLGLLWVEEKEMKSVELKAG